MHVGALTQSAAVARIIVLPRYRQATSPVQAQSLLYDADNMNGTPARDGSNLTGSHVDMGNSFDSPETTSTA